MKKIALALIVLGSLGNSFDDENKFKKALLSERDKTKEPFIEVVGNFDFDCPIIGKSLIGERVRNKIYVYHVKKEGCFKTQKVLNKEVKKLALKCLLENHSKDCNITVDDIELVEEYTAIGNFKNVDFNERNKTEEIELNIGTKDK